MLAGVLTCIRQICHICIATELELCNELFHCPLLLAHIILKYLDLGLEPNVLLPIGISLYLELDRIFIKLLLLFDVIAIGRFHLQLLCCLWYITIAEYRNKLLLLGLLLVQLCGT